MAHHWLDTSEYPFASNYLQLNGQRLHYIDEGKGESVLFLHGTPSWSFDYRRIILSLKEHYRCLAIDHIGFGLSDKPEHYDYSTQNHSLTLEKFVQAKQLKDLTLVVHDFGGVIGLSYAMRFPEKIKRLVILNSWLWSSENDPDFVRMSKLLKSKLLPFLYRYLNFSPKFALPASFGEHKLPRHLLKQYTKPFAKPSQRNGTLAFAQSLLKDQDWFAELWNKRHSIADKPTLFVWGMKDPVIKPHYLDMFMQGFSNSKAIKLNSCGHFPQEEQSELVAAELLTFLKRTG